MSKFWAWVRGILKTRESNFINLNTLESFHERGMQVLAEGVETREECDFLRSLGVDLFQGYYLAMPA